MSMLLADIDATCASLGFDDGKRYIADPGAKQSLKHLIWILRRDNESHEFRRHIGRSLVLKTDLLPMLVYYSDDDECNDILLRLLLNLTNPVELLYRDELPKDGPSRRHYLELIDIGHKHKESFTLTPVWSVLAKRLKRSLATESTFRTDEENLVTERILVLMRNILKTPANPDEERRADDDANIHDQVIFALQQSGILEILLYILGSTDENQYHLHGLEIIFHLFREQNAEELASTSLLNSNSKRQRDETDLIEARSIEKQKEVIQLPPSRHSRFGGTYVYKNVKSISDKDLICHQPLDKAFSMDFDKEKSKQKKSFRVVKEEQETVRRSAFPIRLLLREYCIEILRSAYNNFIRQVRRLVDQSGIGHDDTYLMWAIQFFMEFCRYNDFHLELISEPLTESGIHWILTRVEHHIDMISSDKKNARIWSRRMHIAIKAYKEILITIIALHKSKDESCRLLYKVLVNKICYIIEYRETILHVLMNYNEMHSTRACLWDIVETAFYFIKIMENFCKGSGAVVQSKRRKSVKRKPKKPQRNRDGQPDDEVRRNEELNDKWIGISAELSTILSNGITLPEDEHPIPFDAASDIAIDDQKDDCMIKLFRFLHQGKVEHAILLMRAAREIWPTNESFGKVNSNPEEEMMIVREIFFSDIEKDVKRDSSDDEGDDDDDMEDDEEIEAERFQETEIRFSDFAKRLVNPRVVRACSLVVADWKKLNTRTIKSAVTILYQIAYVCKAPAMLFQASLFRTFQQLFNTSRSSRTEELYRMGVYILSKFIEIAPTNPKIYAELLLYKTIREANELENGYNETYESAAKGTWSEDQENELQTLFMENQANPSTDKDVIDWMLDNLIDKTRTRRGVIKKLKDMGLIFKAPTKKSIATANKNLWQPDEDERLSALYNEFRFENDCMKHIMEVFSEKWSKRAVVKRMLQLGLIADRSEIKPTKQKKMKSHGIENEDTSSDESIGSIEPREKRKIEKRKKKTDTVKKSKSRKERKRKPQVNSVNVNEVRSIIKNMNDELRNVLDWVKESLEDAAEDMDDPTDEPEDGIPLVPFTSAQRDALEHSEFRELLTKLGFQEPLAEMETYWRLPSQLKANDLTFRAALLSDEGFDGIENDMVAMNSHMNEENFNKLSTDEDSSSADENDDDDSEKRRDNLLYNESDDDDDNNSNGGASNIYKPKSTNGDNKDANLNIDYEINSQELDIPEAELQQRLLELQDSEDKENYQINQLNDNPDVSNKRDHHEISDDGQSDDEIIFQQKRVKNTRRAVINDDDEDDE